MGGVPQGILPVFRETDFRFDEAEKCPPHIEDAPAVFTYVGFFALCAERANGDLNPVAVGIETERTARLLISARQRQLGAAVGEQPHILVHPDGTREQTAIS